MPSPPSTEQICDYSELPQNQCSHCTMDDRPPKRTDNTDKGLEAPVYRDVKLKTPSNCAVCGQHMVAGYTAKRKVNTFQPVCQSCVRNGRI